MKEEEKRFDSNQFPSSNIPKKEERQSQINRSQEQIDWNKEQITFLHKLLPDDYQNKSFPGMNPDYFNFYKIFKQFLLLHVSNSSVHPLNMTSPYTKDVPLIQNLNYQKDFLKKVDDTSKPYVILYQEKNTSKKYVLKRFFLKVNLNAVLGSGTDEEKQRKGEIDYFIQEKFLEYSLLKLYSSIPYSTNPLFFRIIYLVSQNMIITELMMDFAGNSFIPENFIKCDPSILKDIFKQLVNIVYSLQNLRIEHGDIKPGNIMVDEILGKIVLRLIDFDTAINQSFNLRNHKGMGPRGLTRVYAAPELIYSIANNNINQIEKFDPWKLHIYSVGVIMLKSIGFNIANTEFDSCKIDKSMYKAETLKKVEAFIENELKSLKKNDVKDRIRANIYELIKKCLAYDPNERPSAFELKNILDQIETIDKNELDGIIKNIRNEAPTILMNNPRIQEIIDLETSKHIKIDNLYGS